MAHIVKLRSQIYDYANLLYVGGGITQRVGMLKKKLDEIEKKIYIFNKDIPKELKELNIEHSKIATHNETINKKIVELQKKYKDLLCGKCNYNENELWYLHKDVKDKELSEKIKQKKQKYQRRLRECKNQQCKDARKYKKEIKKLQHELIDISPIESKLICLSYKLSSYTNSIELFQLAYNRFGDVIKTQQFRKRIGKTRIRLYYHILNEQLVNDMLLLNKYVKREDTCFKEFENIKKIFGYKDYIQPINNDECLFDDDDYDKHTHVEINESDEPDEIGDNWDNRCVSTRDEYIKCHEIDIKKNDVVQQLEQSIIDIEKHSGKKIDPNAPIHRLIKLAHEH